MLAMRSSGTGPRERGRLGQGADAPRSPGSGDRELTLPARTELELMHARWLRPCARGLIGESWDPLTNQWIPFEVETADRRSRGGSFGCVVLAQDRRRLRP